MANIEEAQRFLRLLDEEVYCHTFQTFDDTKDRKSSALVLMEHGELESKFSALESLNTSGAGVYISVQEMDGTGRKSSCVKTIRAVFQEDDGDGKDLPLEPHIIVNTSPGKYHRYILVEDLNISEFNAVMDVIVTRFGGDKNAKDVARVLRLPGFDNHKYGHPYPVTIVHESGSPPYKKEQVLKAFGANIIKSADEYVPVHDGELLYVTESTIADLRDALTRINSDDLKVWTDVGLALKTIGNVGRDLWIEWSKRSDKWKETDINFWNTFKPEKVTYKKVFYMAQEAGWINPMTIEAESADPEEDLFSDLRAIFASELPAQCEFPDELVEGLLVRNEISILYGDSNSGKTFFAIDLACAVSLGINWMKRRTEQGLTVYLASESPSSVRLRIQAYEKHHGVSIGNNLLIVQAPVNFYESDYDINRLVRLLTKVCHITGKRIEFIIGDTLARISAGANENTGDDMGIVMARFDELKDAVQAHIMIIAHSGKDTTKGMRGWSGIRAHVDTEIEVKEKDGIRTATVTKQRGLPGKGEALSFELLIVPMGVTKWGKEATTCVVSPVDLSTIPKKMEHSWETGVLLDAWLASGSELRGNYPYVTRKQIRESIEKMKPGVARKTIDNSMVKFTDLAKKGLLEDYEHGFRVVDGMISSQLIVLKDIH